MPTYEYQCSGCQQTYDVLQKMSAPALMTCIKCGSAHVRKKLSVPTLMLRRGQQPAANDGGRPSTPDAPQHGAIVGRSDAAEGLAVDAVPPDFKHPNLWAVPVIVPKDYPEE